MCTLFLIRYCYIIYIIKYFHIKGHLKPQNKCMNWGHFKEAYVWDNSANPFIINSHRRIYFFFKSENKMRNHLTKRVKL